MEKKSDTYDAVIQHVLPINYKYFGGMKNIGFVALENVKFTNKVWLANLKMMDDVFVPNVASQAVLSDNGISSKIFPHSFNFNKIKSYERNANIVELSNSFNFTFVGEHCHRKNLEALLIAFHNEFNYIEPVNLYIKTSGKSLQEMTNFCEQVKNKLKLCRPMILSKNEPEKSLF